MEQRDITQMVTLPATVEAGLEFRLPAPRAGRYDISGDGLVERTNLGDRPVQLPFGVRVVGATAHAQLVPEGYPVAKATVTGFLMVATVPGRDIARVHRFNGTAVAQIDEGPGPFECKLLATVPLRLAGEVSVACVVPRNLNLFEGMSGKIAINTGAAKGVPTLPIDAIAGDRQRATVWVRSRHGREIRAIEIGKSDGWYVEITSGLAVGERVQVPPPTSGDVLVSSEDDAG